MTLASAQSLAEILSALKDRDEAHHKALEASERAKYAILAARAAGVPWKDIQQATGLSRQRLWQIVKGK